ncbi:MAG: hypothetical protein QOK28_2294 [Actinomycetota bacterium]|jgi:hypothetical protein
MSNDDEPVVFDAPPDDPVTVYMATGLTALNDDQITIVELVSGLIAGYCGESGVVVHQPVMHTHPKDHDNLTPEEVHAKDFSSVCDSDAVIALGDFASWGGGKELAWAERLRTPVLVLHKEGRSISRLVLGGTGDITVARWRFVDDLRIVWNDYFLKRKAQLEAHRRARAARRQIWAHVLANLNGAFVPLDDSDKRQVAAIARLPERRILEMLSSPSGFAEASVDEAIALAGALGLPSTAVVPGPTGPTLPSRALSALATASELNGWDGRRAVELFQQATAELAKGGIRRLSFGEPSDWTDFASD